MRLSIDRERCCSSGQCVLTAPDVFEQSEEDGLVVLRDGQPAGGRFGEVRLAIALCPSGAITVADGDTV